MATDIIMGYGGHFQLPPDPVDQYQEFMGNTMAAPGAEAFEDVTQIFQDGATGMWLSEPPSITPLTLVGLKN